MLAYNLTNEILKRRSVNVYFYILNDDSLCLWTYKLIFKKMYFLN